MRYFKFRQYVPVAQRRRQAAQQMSRLCKQGLDVQPVEVSGSAIARSFWGKAWCNHMEGMRDYDNRLPRGRTYVRNGSVCHLAIDKGRVVAIVSGSQLYDVNVSIKVLHATRWRAVKQKVSGEIGSLIELLQGKFSDNVMRAVTDRGDGLFPTKTEISYKCSCPDWASMCKHVAAVMYGIGSRLDERPELLFVLRGVDHQELVTAPAEASIGAATQRGGRRRTVASEDLADLFGIELEDATPQRGARKVAKQEGAAKKPVAAKKPAAQAAQGAKASARKGAVKKKAPLQRKKVAKKGALAKREKKRA